MIFSLFSSAECQEKALTPQQARAAWQLRQNSPREGLSIPGPQHLWHIRRTQHRHRVQQPAIQNPASKRLLGDKSMQNSNSSCKQFDAWQDITHGH